MAPNRNTDASSTALRPQRSDRRPPIAAPSMSPNVAALKNQPSSFGPRPNTAATLGATPPAACRSKPSNTDTLQHSASGIQVVLELIPAGAASPTVAHFGNVASRAVR